MGSFDEFSTWTVILAVLGIIGYLIFGAVQIIQLKDMSTAGAVAWFLCLSFVSSCLFFHFNNQ
jgi:hypothetical protein